MKFPTQFAKRKRFESNPGSHFMNTYAPKYDENGVMTLVISGETDRHAMIQVDKDSCNIALIVKKFMNGDSDALNKVKGFYADVSDAPTTFAEMCQRVTDCKILFEGLKPEIKEQFNNSYEQFWSSAGSDEWFSILNPTSSSASTPYVKKSDNVDVESEVE